MLGRQTLSPGSLASPLWPFPKKITPGPEICSSWGLIRMVRGLPDSIFLLHLVFKKTVVKHMQHKIYHLKHFYVCVPVALRTSTVLYNYHHRLPLERFHLHSALTSHRPLCPAPAATVLLSMDLATPGTVNKWNLTEFVLCD